jgi:hypothetical protein
MGVYRVIGKVLRGTDARRLLYYLYGPGKANEHTDPHLVAGFADPAELEPERRPSGAPDLRRLAGLLAQPLAALAGSGYDKPVWHCSVRAAPQDRGLTDAEWAQVAARIMHRTGLAPEGDDLGVRWVAVRHAADHIHIVATLARQDGTRPKVWNDFYRVREACQEAECRFGLRRTAPADRTAARRATHAETEQAARRGWGEPPRASLRREVCTAAAGAATEQEFFARLRQAGVLVRLRHSVTNPGEVTGYAVGLPQHTARDGGVIWYGGGKLAPDLTLPKLRTRWAIPAWHHLADGTGLPAPAARAVLRSMVVRAAEHSPDEASFFARLRECGVLVRLRFSETDPGQVTGYAATLPAIPGRTGHRPGTAGDGSPLGSPCPGCGTAGGGDGAVPRSTRERYGSLPRNATPFTRTRAARPLRRRSTSVAAPTVIRRRRPTPPGRRPTPFMSRRGRCAAGSCDAPPTPTTAPPAPPTGGCPGAPATVTSSAAPPG